MISAVATPAVMQVMQCMTKQKALASPRDISEFFMAKDGTALAHMIEVSIKQIVIRIQLCSEYFFHS